MKKRNLAITLGSLIFWVAAGALAETSQSPNIVIKIKPGETLGGALQRDFLPKIRAVNQVLAVDSDQIKPGIYQTPFVDEAGLNKLMAERAELSRKIVDLSRERTATLEATAQAKGNLEKANQLLALKTKELVAKTSELSMAHIILVILLAVVIGFGLWLFIIRQEAADNVELRLQVRNLTEDRLNLSTKMHSWCANAQGYVLDLLRQHGVVKSPDGFFRGPNVQTPIPSEAVAREVERINQGLPPA